MLWLLAERAKGHPDCLEPARIRAIARNHGDGADAAICPTSQNTLIGTRRYADPTSHTTTSNRRFSRTAGPEGLQNNLDRPGPDSGHVL